MAAFPWPTARAMRISTTWSGSACATGRRGLAAVLLPHAPALAQFRNVGPGVADRTATVARGGADDAVIFGGEVQTTLELDVNGRRRQQRAYGDLFTESLLATDLLLPYGFAANAVARLEPAPRDADGRGRLFRKQTAWVDELFLTWSTRSLDVFGGKFHPRFGGAWDRGPGLFGTDFSREYELTERMVADYPPPSRAPR